ncbi:PREDICTED: uncharacterized protein LOC109192460 [Ipomoea nil]|uniref:uncharacterized protein LOC109192460 n=1 Tax=Ipomoea nil TaxID=35883 RepID=UPI0009012276|nr:PREDICTED: uncharacterized protein LOC109192460 [Ipomoea nil]
MKFFSWMQSKINGGKPNPVSPAHYHRKEAQKEEFKDWPDSLLAIGTFGNNNQKKTQDSGDSQSQREEILQDNDEQSSSPDLTEFTAEDVGKLQKELTKLLSRKPASKPESAEIMNNAADLPLDRFLNCPSSLEVDRRNSSTLSTNSDNSSYDYDEDEIDRTIRVIIGRCKDVCEKSRKQQKTLGKKSLSFLLKKVFACRSGIAPTPSLRDTFQESRMEKLLRTMLSKKVYSQTSSRPSTSMKRYLEDKQTSRTDEEEEQKRDKTCDSGRWDKTDSEFIVLEI